MSVDVNENNGLMACVFTMNIKIYKIYWWMVVPVVLGLTILMALANSMNVTLGEICVAG